MQDDLLTPKQLEARLGVSRATLAKYREMGMPYVQPASTTYRYRWDEIETWLKSQKDKMSKGEGK
jgi:predicted site-specific integrase-resolvase